METYMETSNKRNHLIPYVEQKQSTITLNDVRALADQKQQQQRRIFKKRWHIKRNFLDSSCIENKKVVEEKISYGFILKRLFSSLLSHMGF